MKKLLAMVVITAALSLNANASVKSFMAHPALLTRSYKGGKVVVKDSVKASKAIGGYTVKVLF